MISRVLNVINRFSLADPLIRVNDLFFNSNKKNTLNLKNNFVFRHACMTPLTIISCSLDAVEHAESQRERVASLTHARKAVSHLNKLITSITNINTDEFSFDVHQATTEVIYLFENKANCAVLYTNFIPKGLELSGSKLHYQEIIICLLNNAYEAYQNKKIAHISLSVRIINNSIFIGVADFAKGMTGVAQKLATVKGVSYKKDGLGLGLSFVKETVEKNFNGSLKMISGYGVGTHVQVTIPVPKSCSQNLSQS